MGSSPTPALSFFFAHDQDFNVWRVMWSFLNQSEWKHRPKTTLELTMMRFAGSSAHGLILDWRKWNCSSFYCCWSSFLMPGRYLIGFLLACCGANISSSLYLYVSLQPTTIHLCYIYLHSLCKYISLLLSFQHISCLM